MSIGDMNVQEKLDFAEVEVPDNPGPALADRTPVLGSIRRSNGAPVARDELKD